MRNNNIVLDSKKSVFAVIMVTNHISVLHCDYYDNTIAIYSAKNYAIRIVDDRQNYEVIFNDYDNDIKVNYTWNNINDLFVWQYEKINTLENEINDYKISLKHDDENIQFYLAKIDELTKENKYKNEVIDEQEKTIFTLDETVNFYRKFNIELNEKIDYLNGIIKNLNEIIDNQDNKIEYLNDFICSLQKHLYYDRVEIEEKNKTIERQNKSIEFLRKSRQKWIHKYFDKE